MSRVLRALLHPAPELITPGARWSLAVLLLLVLGLTAASLWFTAHEVARLAAQVAQLTAEVRKLQQGAGC